MQLERKALHLMRLQSQAVFLGVSPLFSRMTNLWPLCISPTKLRENKKRPKHPNKGALDVDVQNRNVVAALDSHP
jgi:hypothetical protein